MEMANSPNGGPHFRTEPAQQTRIVVSRPDEIVRHEISDEELQMLSDLRRDWAMEAFWGFFGGRYRCRKGRALGSIGCIWGKNKKPHAIWRSLRDHFVFRLFLSRRYTVDCIAVARFPR